MRRYAVRFLVAILTFGIGVTLSLILGLFKPREINITQTWNRRTCSKSFRYARPPFVTVDNHADGPLKLVYSSANSDRRHGRMQVSVENRSGKRVSEYIISGEKIWQTSGKTSHNYFDWSFGDLEPGESRFITLPLNTEGMALRVVKVSFQDGSTWTNPRDAR